MELPSWLQHPSQRARTTTVPASQVPSKPLMPGGPPPTFAPWLDVLNHPSQRQSYLEKLKASFQTEDPMAPEAYPQGAPQGDPMAPEAYPVPGQTQQQFPQTMTVRPPQRPSVVDLGVAQSGGESNTGDNVQPSVRQHTSPDVTPNGMANYADPNSRNYSPQLAGDIYADPAAFGFPSGVQQPSKEQPGSGLQGFLQALAKPGTPIGDFSKTGLGSLFRTLAG